MGESRLKKKKKTIEIMNMYEYTVYIMYMRVVDPYLTYGRTCKMHVCVYVCALESEKDLYMQSAQSTFNMMIKTATEGNNTCSNLMPTNTKYLYNTYIVIKDSKDSIEFGYRNIEILKSSWLHYIFILQFSELI